MKRFLYTIAVLFVALVAGGCSDDEETLLANQQSSILKYLTGTLKLVSEAEAQGDNLQQENPPFYTVYGEWAYRWIRNYYDADRRNQPMARAGSVVELTLSIYPFSGSSISDSAVPLYTNDESLRSILERAGLNTTYWSFEPYVVEVGAGNTIPGLDAALAGCREGDEVELYMTFSMAYDRDWFSTLPPDSQLAIFYTVNKVD